MVTHPSNIPGWTWFSSEVSLPWAHWVVQSTGSKVKVEYIRSFFAYSCKGPIVPHSHAILCLMCLSNFWLTHTGTIRNPRSDDGSQNLFQTIICKRTSDILHFYQKAILGLCGLDYETVLDTIFAINLKFPAMTKLQDLLELVAASLCGWFILGMLTKTRSMKVYFL